MSSFERLEGRQLLTVATLTGIYGPTMNTGPATVAGNGPEIIVPSVHGAVVGNYAGDAFGSYAGKSIGSSIVKIDITSYSADGTIKGKVYATIPGLGTQHFNFDTKTTFTSSGGFSVHANNTGFDGKIKGDFHAGGDRATGTIVGTIDGKAVSISFSTTRRS